MEQRFISEIRQLQETTSFNHLVLAVSGGVDSIVLVNLVKESGVSFSIAHCNFKLRGEESNLDESFVKTLAEGLGVEVHTKSFATEAWAKENGISIQMAARDLRYEWFAELISDPGSFLVTAHHANDIAETMLFNLTKGSGISGLHGIKRLTKKKLRPLLWATKQEILGYATSNGLAWREDKSNSENKYGRNLIRNIIIPELEKINPAFIESARKTSKRIDDAEQLIEHFVKELNLSTFKGGHFYIGKDKIVSLPGKATLLHRLISPYGFNHEQINDIVDSFDTIGAVFHSKTHTLNVDRQHLILSAIKEKTPSMLVDLGNSEFRFGPQEYRARIVDIEDYSILEDRNIAGLDLGRLQFPLTIRLAQEGDRFQPLGMKGKKLISDFLIDEKIPVNLKHEQAVVLSGNDIVWVAGRRIDHRFKIGELTEKVFEIKVENAL